MWKLKKSFVDIFIEWYNDNIQYVCELNICFKIAPN